MMTRSELLACLDHLGLTQAQAADLLSVSARTVRRWLEQPADLPGPAEQALRAWRRLADSNLPWRPDGVDLISADRNELAEQVARYRLHAIDLDALIRRVRARGGPSTPWQIDLPRREATLGPITVSFYALANGSFSPSSYSRADREPDLGRDWALIEDAAVCFADAVSSAGRGWADRGQSAA